MDATATPAPQPADGAETLQTPMRHLILDGVCSQVLGVLTGGAFLVAFALMLGANNVTIGVIAAIPSLAQLMQVPALYIVNRIKRRRLISVACSTVGRHPRAG